MRWMMAALVALAGCSGGDEGVSPNATVIEPGPGPSTTVAAPIANGSEAAAAAKPEADYLGRWVGVEGMYLVVAKRPAGGVSLEMQYDLDHKGMFDGTVTGEPDGTAIVFERAGKQETLRPTDGDATGLKYLAGKKDCLTVKSGEGYCRD